MSVVLAAIERVEASGRVRRRGDWLLCVSSYEPWSAQRILHRSDAKYRILVAGRGIGKTYAAAYELLQLVLAAPIGAEAGVLAPSYTHAEQAVKTLRELASVLPFSEWKKMDKRLWLPGRRSIRVYSMDREGSARGPTFCAIWFDEAALIKFSGIQASMPALRDRRVRTRAIVTTTPVGKNWVWDWWCMAEEERNYERFRFSALDSPYQDQEVIEDMRRGGMDPDFFAQEYLAEFVDNLLLVFPDRDELFTERFTIERDPKRTKNWIGLDVGGFGKTSRGHMDWMCLTLMNEWGETQVLDRWQVGSRPGVKRESYWEYLDKRSLEFAERYKAMFVIDTGGAGAAAGAVLAERLRKAGVPVMEVRTNVQGTKAQIVEQAKADVAWGKIRVLGLPSENPLCKQLDYELSTFQGIKRVSRGQEMTVYEGPQIRGEHDDMVISLCLANWGRDRSEHQGDTGDGGLASFKPIGPTSGGRQGVSRVGYIFQRRRAA